MVLSNAEKRARKGRRTPEDGALYSATKNRTQQLSFLRAHAGGVSSEVFRKHVGQIPREMHKASDIDAAIALELVDISMRRSDPTLCDAEHSNVWAKLRMDSADGRMAPQVSQASTISCS